MKIYSGIRTDSVWWDEYIGAVVFASSPKKAIEMVFELIKDGEYGPKEFTREDLRIEFLGTAAAGKKEGFILRSFKAG